ncbi:tetratricopeptide repeat-containing sensor histidine kinase [Spirosoma radiotolerans]|uniref:histidine kinase n=1 Tax=Spirosoma radiotolerans TaxID=1379870 RepID=A0A0E3ZUI8_9BACT|nr:tetratricopeptide repeat-containing sensor histidine kinase [Spirosoma radiotolerans]AKD54490.1 sensor protein uhpB [Spirosoma radiotolerans]
MKNISLLVYFCYLVTGPYTVRAQVPQTLDSVTVYLKNHTSQDTNYVRALNVMGRELHSTANPDYKRADSVLQLSEQLAMKLQYGLGLAKAYTNRASIYYLTDRPQQALEYFQKALTIAETHKLNPRFICGAISNIAAALSKLGQYDKVVAMELRSLRLQEQYNVQPRIATTYGGIGNAFRELNKPREALPYYRQALALMKTTKNTSGMGIIENNIGICYDNLKQYDKSLPYYKQGLKHAQEAKFELLQADILVNIGLALKLSKRPEEGIPFVKRSLAIAQKQGHQAGMATACFNLGQLYEELKQYTPAETYMLKALQSARERNNKEQINNYTQGLADLYGGMKNFQQAYAFQLERNQHIDSMTTVRTTAEVQRLVAHYKSQQKQDQINLLRQQAQIREEELTNKRLQTNALLIGGLLTLLLGAAVSAWLLNRARLRRLQEAQTLRKQIAHDLHDEVGSTLSSISLLSGMVKGLIAQNRPESVERAIQKINTDARQILEAMDEIIWTINPGNDSLHRIAIRLQEYAQPLMESKGIRFSLVAEPALEGLPISMEVRRNLYLIGKEAINNLVKYSQASQATLRFEHQKEQLKVVIEDNGRGFDPAQPSQRTGQSSMQQRAKAMGGSLEVHSAPEQGTSLVLITSLVAQ